MSPDGGRLAVYEQDGGVGGSGRIRVLPASGGEGQTVYSFSGPEDDPTLTPHGFLGAPNAFAWTPDGHYLLFGGFEAVGKSTLYRLSVETGAVAPVLRLDLRSEANFRGFSLHPDGRRIAFRGGDSEGEIWVIEGLPGTE